jgi:PST family polysaccharide transporter
MSLVHQTFSAVKWTVAAKISQQGLQFLLLTVLMRLLDPAAFGLLGMVMVFSGFVAVFSEMGFGSALVQRQDLSEEHRSTIFWFMIAFGGLLGGVLFAAGPLIAAFYKEPILKPMSAWVALSFLLGAPGVVSRSLLTKALRFDVLAKVDVTALIVSGGLAAAAAACGAGVWSLIAQQLVSAGLTSALLFWFGGWRPLLLWSSQALGELFGYGAGLTGFNIVNYWARSADKLLIGGLLGSVALGLYSRAYSLMLLPLTQIVGVLTPAMFPAMSTIKDDKARVRRVFLQMTTLVSFIAFPMMLGLAVVAEPFVSGLFGAKWAGAIPLIQVLGVVGMVQALCNPAGLIYTSQGRTDWMFWWGIGGAGFLVLCIVAGALMGSVRSVATAYLVGNLVIAGPCLAIPGRLIGMSLGDVWRAISGNLACASCMAVVVGCVSSVLPMWMTPLVRLIVLVPLGGAVYGTLAYVSRLTVLAQLAQLRLRVASC